MSRRLLGICSAGFCSLALVTGRYALRADDVSPEEAPSLPEISAEITSDDVSGGDLPLPGPTLSADDEEASDIKFLLPENSAESTPAESAASETGSIEADPDEGEPLGTGRLPEDDSDQQSEPSPASPDEGINAVDSEESTYGRAWDDPPESSAADDATPDDAESPADAQPASEKPQPASQRSQHAVERQRPPAKPSSAAAELTPEMLQLHKKLNRVLATYERRHLNAREHSAWELMHSIIAYGMETEIYRNGPSGETVNAIHWMCANGTCRGERMMYLDHGKIVARKGPGLQGHYGQFLAILAQSQVPRDYPMMIGGQSFTVQDLVEHEKADCQPGEELTFKLIALMHYLDSDDTWTSRDGQEWSLQRLVQEELKQPIRGAACGGTHRMMGFSYAVHKRIEQQKPVEGEFRRAQIFVNDYHRYTFGMQNPDGSFSTEWFVRRGSNPDADRRLKTTGHILEWLSFSVSDEELRNPRTVQAVNYLADLLLSDTKRTWEVGPLGHGLHALAIYDARLFGRPNAQPAKTIAKSGKLQTAQKKPHAAAMR